VSVPWWWKPEVNVTGNGNTIFDGDRRRRKPPTTQISAALLSTVAKVQKVFNIQNTGSATLTLGEVSATGDFSVIVQPGTSIAPGGDANFTVEFDPRGLGLRTGTISFINNDTAAPSESPYNFTIRGTGI
jgi:hypothetical protein